MAARPSLVCLREDLGLGLPVLSAQVPLDEVDHPLLRKAQEQFTAGDTPSGSAPSTTLRCSR